MTDNSQKQSKSRFQRASVLVYPLLIAGGGYIVWVERTVTYVLRNLLPFVLVASLAWFVLSYRRRSGARHDLRWLLGLVGFSIPSVGLSLYLHWRWQWDIDQIRSLASRPELLFRYLPAYSFTAGLIGFWIGWIIGKNLNQGS